MRHYTLRMHPGTTLGAVTGLAQGTRTLDQLKNQSGTLSSSTSWSRGQRLGKHPRRPRAALRGL